MPDIKRILFLIVILLSFYVLYKLVQRRSRLITEYEKSQEELDEGFVGSSSSSARPRISNTSNLSFPLKEYVFMSSWNSASNSTGVVSLDTLEETLMRGYRFIDLEVYSVESKPQVSFSTQRAYDAMESNPILFVDVCRRIITKAFTTTNGQDPLFLHLRIKSRNPNLFEMMANILKVECESRLYNKKVTLDTPLEKVKGRLVIVVDRTYVPHLESYECSGKCTNDFKKMINMYSGTPGLESMKIMDKLEQPKQVLQQTDNGRTNVSKLQMVVHGMGELNVEKNGPEFFTMVHNYRVQIVPIKAYYKDESLTEYENFFKNNGHRAFVPMSVAFNFIQDRL